MLIFLWKNSYRELGSVLSLGTIEAWCLLHLWDPQVLRTASMLHQTWNLAGKF